MPYKNFYACFNGKILLINKPVSFYKIITDLGWSRGWHIFDVMEARNNIPFHEKNHLKRLLRSAQKAYLPIKNNKHLNILALSKIIRKLLKKNKFPESLVRIDITGGKTISSNYLNSKNVNFFIQVNPIKFKNKIQTLSLKAIYYKREFPQIKTANYFISCAMFQKFQKQNYQDILFIDKNNRILETSRKNIFFVNKKNEILTPNKDILLGITRKIIIKLAKSNNYTVKEKEIKIKNLPKFKEAFATSTNYFVAPIINIEGIVNLKFPIGEITKHLYKLFMAYRDKYYQKNKLI